MRSIVWMRGPAVPPPGSVARGDRRISGRWCAECLHVPVYRTGLFPRDVQYRTAIGMCPFRGRAHHRAVGLVVRARSRFHAARRSDKCPIVSNVAFSALRVHPHPAQGTRVDACSRRNDSPPRRSQCHPPWMTTPLCLPRSRDMATSIASMKIDVR